MIYISAAILSGSAGVVRTRPSIGEIGVKAKKFMPFIPPPIYGEAQEVQTCRIPNERCHVGVIGGEPVRYAASVSLLAVLANLPLALDGLNFDLDADDALNWLSM